MRSCEKGTIRNSANGHFSSTVVHCGVILFFIFNHVLVSDTATLNFECLILVSIFLRLKMCVGIKLFLDLLLVCRPIEIEGHI